MNRDPRAPPETRSLRDIQKAVQAYVLCGDPGAEARVLSTARVAARVRLDIYAQGYRMRLKEALEDDFQALRASMGEAAFERLADGYIEACPSKHFSLRYFGQALPAHLGRGEHAARPWLAELASFEWLLGEAFDAPGAVPLGIDALASVPPASWPALSFLLHPSVRRIDLAWNVPAVRAAVESGQDPPAAEAFEVRVPWLLWRKELKTYYRSLEPDEAAGLDRIGEGASFGRLCEDLCRWVAEDAVAARAAGFLRRWVMDGLLTEIRIV